MRMQVLYLRAKGEHAREDNASPHISHAKGHGLVNLVVLLRDQGVVAHDARHDRVVQICEEREGKWRQSANDTASAWVRRIEDRQGLQNKKSGASAHEQAGRGETRSKATGWVERQRTRKARLIGLLIVETEVSDQACDFMRVWQALDLQTNAREMSVSTELQAASTASYDQHNPPVSQIGFCSRLPIRRGSAGMRRNGVCARQQHVRPMCEPVCTGASFSH
jgi:hypothetical protein